LFFDEFIVLQLRISLVDPVVEGFSHQETGVMFVHRLGSSMNLRDAELQDGEPHGKELFDMAFRA